MLKNAIAELAVQSQGKIKIEASVTSSPEGNKAEIAITDSGVDVPKEIQEHLFNPFFSKADNAEVGGLGLCMAYELMGEQEGSLEFRQGDLGEKQFVMCFKI